MKISYDEYIATWQSPEAKEDLDNRIDMDRKNRYIQRQKGAGRPESVQKLDQMSQEEFESLRRHQMSQLFEAYKYAHSGHRHDLLAISYYDTKPEMIRRVVGDKAGYIYNNDILALDKDTIIAINYLANMREFHNDYAPGEKVIQELSYNSLSKVVDEMISTKNILVENMNLGYDDSSYDKIYRETNIAKRAIGKAQQRPSDELTNRMLPEKVGLNVFRIKDYELSWDELVERKSKVWTKTVGKFFRFLDRKINTSAERNNPNRIGNRTVEVPDEYTGGER